MPSFSQQRESYVEDLRCMCRICGENLGMLRLFCLKWWRCMMAADFIKKTTRSSHNTSDRFCYAHWNCWINISPFHISWLSCLLSICINCLTREWHWQKTAATQNNTRSSCILPLLKSHSSIVPLALETISRWIPPVARKLPAGCHVGKRKRKRRSCEPVWRSCWLAWRSSPRCSRHGRGGLAGSVGGETWWAPVGSVDLPQHWAPWIRSIFWHWLAHAHCLPFIWKTQFRKLRDRCYPAFPILSQCCWYRMQSHAVTDHLLYFVPLRNGRSPSISMCWANSQMLGWEALSCSLKHEFLRFFSLHQWKSLLLCLLWGCWRKSSHLRGETCSNFNGLTQ